MPEHKEHLVAVGKYVTVLAALMVLLIITISAAFIDIDAFTRPHGLGSGWNTAIALTIAVVKGLLILLFFMHVRYGSRITWAFSAAGFVWLMIMLSLMMTDYFSRNHPAGANAKGEPVYVLPPQPEVSKQTLSP
jgi:cytochrome c oxidase subunit IV